MLRTKKQTDSSILPTPTNSDDVGSRVSHYVHSNIASISDFYWFTYTDDQRMA